MSEQFNGNNHIIFTIFGRELNGSAEINRLKNNGYAISSDAQSVLLSTRPLNYDEKHHLVHGKEYTIVLISGNQFGRNERTANNLLREMFRHGYERPLAGIMPRIREEITPARLKNMNTLLGKMGFNSIWALHAPTSRTDSVPFGLGISSSELSGFQWRSLSGEDLLPKNCAFAFIQP
jgi:hypothetical protein